MLIRIKCSLASGPGVGLKRTVEIVKKVAAIGSKERIVARDEVD